MSKIKDLINDDKPREQAKAKGIENLTNSSLLALIINSGIKGYSCIDLANEVLKKCTSVDNLINLTYNDLISIKGMKDAKVYRILSLIELVKRINSNINKKIDIKIKELLLSIDMEINDFLKNFANQWDETEIEVFVPECEFHELEEWSSLIGLAILNMCAKKYGVKGHS